MLTIRSFFCAVFMLFSVATHAMDVAEFLGKYIQCFPSNGEVDNKQEHNKDEEFVIVEKPEIEPLDLSILDKEQEKQNNKTVGDGQVFEYSKEVLSCAFKPFSGVKNHGMRTLCRYVPKNNNQKNKPELLLVVHGTYGGGTPGYKDPSSNLFKNIVRYAALAAQEHKAIYDIYSYEWSGGVEDRDRTNAGGFLEQILNRLQHYYAEFHAFNHSHGLGPVLVANNGLLYKRFIKRCYAIGSPVLEGNFWRYAPHVGLLLNFISREDWVQPIGYAYSSDYGNTCKDWNYCKKGSEKEPFGRDGKTYKKPCHGQIANVHLTYDNYWPGHSELPLYVSKYLGEIRAAIESDFECEKKVLNLAVNIIPAGENDYCDAINISLYPLTEEEATSYKELPEKMRQLSEKNRKIYEKVYGGPKKLEFQMGYWEKTCSWFRGAYKTYKTIQ